jgi:hypothetical protein
MIELKDTHSGETAWIVAKGPSVLNLKKTDIGDGPIIALYETIAIVEMLDLPNPVYSLQKDGGQNKTHVAPTTILSSECESRDCKNCGWVARPQKATLLLHDLEAEFCFPDYSPRYLFNLAEIGLPYNTFSLVCALKIAQFLGCTKFMFVSADAQSIGDLRCCLPIYPQKYYDHDYAAQRIMFPAYLEGLDYGWITPQGAT